MVDMDSHMFVLHQPTYDPTTTTTVKEFPVKYLPENSSNGQNPWLDKK